jgi:hypothetical protein
VRAGAATAQRACPTGCLPLPFEGGDGTEPRAGLMADLTGGLERVSFL